MKKITAISKKEIVKQMLTYLLGNIVLILYFKKGFNMLAIIDSMLLMGILFTCVGLYRYTRWSGFYDSIIYGYKRLLYGLKKHNDSREKMVEYADFLSENHYMEPILESLLIGILSVVLSYLLMFIFV